MKFNFHDDLRAPPQLELRELAPTATEVEKFDLDIIDVPSNNVNNFTRDTCLNNSDDDFVDPVARTSSRIGFIKESRAW
ncbi:hypothetical protein AG4045_013660 [Apium graveolens]|uniref:Uncharacterized protein n=1 Tax=Apium graveolens TaxID=4045 RepID=A0A6L5BDX5_APIGR|nr:hypothetical protein AG4045_013660 [Apium graveolens]